MTHRVTLGKRLQLLFSLLADLNLGASSPVARWTSRCRVHRLRRRKTRHWRPRLRNFIHYPASLLTANPDGSDAHRLSKKTASAHNQVPLVEEFDTTDRPAVARIARLYELIHDRKADPDGLRAYVTELKHGTPLVDIVRKFL